MAMCTIYIRKLALRSSLPDAIKNIATLAIYVFFFYFNVPPSVDFAPQTITPHPSVATLV